MDFELTQRASFVDALYNMGKEADSFAWLNSNDFKDQHSSYDLLCAYNKVCVFESSNNNITNSYKDFYNQNKDWLFGFFSYDLKNDLEALHSAHPDRIEMPVIHFFVPQLVFLLSDNHLRIGYLKEYHTVEDITQLFHKLTNDSKENTNSETRTFVSEIHPVVDKDAYLSTIDKIKNHIQQGDIYEMNYCIEFYGSLLPGRTPFDLYSKLNKLSPAPFSCLFNTGSKSLVCASPERFLKKKGATLIAQPIKGTAPRSNDAAKDAQLAKMLTQSTKDKSENVMIVDLMRNDLSHFARKGSVRVDELFGIYSYAQVHQMISTVACELEEADMGLEALLHCFPPGSMTGAPKIRAMQIIEDCENTKRGLYSGCVGYFTPDRDFDFNVVIRSILMNQDTNCVSFMAGGAITIQSDPHMEYEECLLKAFALQKTLSGNHNTTTSHAK